MWPAGGLSRQHMAAPPVARSQGSAYGPCRGDGGGPQPVDFPGSRGGEKRKNRKVCTTLPCLPLLKTAKEEARLIPIRRRKPVERTGIYTFSIINSLHFHSSPKTQYVSVASRITSSKPTAL